MTKRSCRLAYFLICLVIIIGLSSVRTEPVYGKLDFLLLDGRPWWPSWRPMIEEIIHDGRQPIFSDRMTSSVLRAVFNQRAVSFRFDSRFIRLNVTRLSELNEKEVSVLPVGGLYLMLHDDQCSSDDSSYLVDILEKYVGLAIEQQKDGRESTPYRCVINVRGFAPSWVPRETRHWPRRWADTSFWYEFEGMRGKDMVQLLREDPPGNCKVYF